MSQEEKLRGYGKLQHRATRYDLLKPIMDEHKAACSAKEFYWEVNEAFHTVEAQSYDDIHAGMFAGSDPMWSRLLKAVPGEGWEVLDVGCGTGLVGEHLNRLAPGKTWRLVMLDPNDAMLERSRERSKGWSTIECEFVKGDIAAVEGRQFDVITVSSVFHHVVEIEAFSATINRLLKPGGFLLQMQDPRADAATDNVLKQRRDEAGKRRRPSLYRRTRSAVGDVLRAVGIKQSVDPVADQTNRILLRKGVIQKPLSMATIWAITDFHVPGQPANMSQGLSVQKLEDWLKLTLVDSFTYDFHSRAWDELFPDEKAKEAAWWAAKDTHGALFGSVWQRAFS